MIRSANSFAFVSSILAMLESTKKELAEEMETKLKKSKGRKKWNETFKKKKAHKKASACNSST